MRLALTVANHLIDLMRLVTEMNRSQIEINKNLIRRVEELEKR